MNLTRGQLIGGAYGFRVAQPGGKPIDVNCVTGVVNMTGGSIRNTGNWESRSTMHGLIVGAGTVANLTVPGFFRGTLNLAGGAVTNDAGAHYTGVGLGVGFGVGLAVGAGVRFASSV